MSVNSTPKANRDVLEKLRRQNPDMSFNEICGWTLYELEHTEKEAKDLKIPLDLYMEANIYIDFVSRLIGKKIQDLTEVLQNEDIKYDEAMDGDWRYIYE